MPQASPASGAAGLNRTVTSVAADERGFTRSSFLGTTTDIENKQLDWKSQGRHMLPIPAMTHACPHTGSRTCYLKRFCAFQLGKTEVEKLHTGFGDQDVGFRSRTFKAT
jgi:hypothetical protein